MEGHQVMDDSSTGIPFIDPIQPAPGMPDIHNMFVMFAEVCGTWLPPKSPPRRRLCIFYSSSLDSWVYEKLQELCQVCVPWATGRRARRVFQLHRCFREWLFVQQHYIPIGALPIKTPRPRFTVVALLASSEALQAPGTQGMSFVLVALPSLPPVVILDVQLILSTLAGKTSFSLIDIVVLPVTI